MKINHSSVTRHIAVAGIVVLGGVHLLLAHREWLEVRLIGLGFLLNFVAAALLAVRIVRRCDRAAWIGALLYATTSAAAYVASRTSWGLFGMHEEWSVGGIVCLAVEAAIVVRAVQNALPGARPRRVASIVATITMLVGAVAFPSAASFAWGGGGTGGGTGTCTNSGCTTAFAVALPIPQVLAPTSSDATTDYYTITEQTANAPIIPGKTTPVWTYNGQFPGPTIKATSGRTVKVHVVNNLPENTNVHLHGAHVASTSDGGPADPIAPGASRDYVYPNQQSARTEWYHDHAMDVTGAHVYKGMAGMFLISDSQEQSFKLPTGANDVPLVLQDRKFNADGTLAYSSDPSRGGFMGDVQLVNGAAQPYFKVTARKVRFRVLNGSNARYYTLKLSNGQAMTQIGNESGFFSAPVSTTAISLAPAERADVIIDFSKVAVGTSVTLQNGDRQSIGDLMRFDVTGTATDSSTIPSTLRPFTAIPSSQATVNRSFTIGTDRNGTWVFNGAPYDMNRIDANVALNGTEIWTFDNQSGQDHPIHIHDINFQVLNESWGSTPASDSQWKETVNVPSWSSVKVIAKFTDFTGPFVFHCHILEHEDKALMGTFSVA